MMFSCVLWLYGGLENYFQILQGESLTVVHIGSASAESATEVLLTVIYQISESRCTELQDMYCSSAQRV